MEVPKSVFCRVWREARSIDEVAQRLNMTVGVCGSRATSYRDQGERLQVLRPRQKQKKGHRGAGPAYTYN